MRHSSWHTCGSGAWVAMNVIGIGVVALLSQVPFAEIARAENLIMPQELVEHAAEQGCRQIANFYSDRPGPVNPPFVYGYLPGPEEDSAVYWCEKGPKDHPTYVLVLMFKRENGDVARCPRRVEWVNPARGLSIIRGKRLTLDDFVPLDNPRQRPPKGIRVTHPAIRSEYDGVEEIFYCHQGRWFVRQRH